MVVAACELDEANGVEHKKGADCRRRRTADDDRRAAGRQCAARTRKGRGCRYKQNTAGQQTEKRLLFEGLSGTARQVLCVKRGGKVDEQVRGRGSSRGV